MMNTTNKPVVTIPRAGTVHEIQVSKLLPPRIQRIVNPSKPADVGISCYQEPDRPRSSSFLIYDRSHAVRPWLVMSMFRGGMNESEIEQFDGLDAGRDRIYQPVMFFSGTAVNDAIYDYYSDVADAFKGQGLAEIQYGAMKSVLRKCGFAFVGGVHFAEGSAKFFLLGGGRLYQEFEDPTPFAPLLFEAEADPVGHKKRYVVAECLDRKGEAALIRKEWRDATIDDRLALLGRMKDARYLVNCMQMKKLTDSMTATIGEVMDDMRARGIPLFIDFAELDAGAGLTKRLMKRQFGLLWDHVDEIAALYTEKELNEYISWFG